MEQKLVDNKVTPLDDKEIIDGVVSGKQHLFELLMRRYNQRLFRLARSILKDTAEAEDVLQEAYLLAYTHLHTVQGQSAGAWLAKIVTNEALARLRKSNYLQSLDSLSSAEQSSFSTTGNNNVMKITTGPETAASAVETRSLIEAAVDALPVDYRLVFVLRAIEQLNVKEAAEYLDIKAATVKTRFHRAKLLLQNRLCRQIEETAPETFTFGGRHCDQIVFLVFKRLENFGHLYM